MATRATRVLVAGGEVGSAVWSPRGTKIAFVGPRGIDGSGVRRMTPASLVAGHPAWSRDGSRLAFASSALATLGIWTMKSSGGDLQRLTRGSAATPEWRPGG